MSPIDPETARLRATVAAHARWSKCADRTAATAAAREAAENRWERLVDPDGTLDEAERARRALSARKAEMARLNLRRRMASRGSGTGEESSSLPGERGRAG